MFACYMINEDSSYFLFYIQRQQYYNSFNLRFHIILALIYSHIMTVTLPLHSWYLSPPPYPWAGPWSLPRSCWLTRARRGGGCRGGWGPPPCLCGRGSRRARWSRHWSPCRHNLCRQKLCKYKFVQILIEDDIWLGRLQVKSKRGT